MEQFWIFAIFRKSFLEDVILFPQKMEKFSKIWKETKKDFTWLNCTSFILSTFLSIEIFVWINHDPLPFIF